MAVAFICRGSVSATGSPYGDVGMPEKKENKRVQSFAEERCVVRCREKRRERQATKADIGKSSVCLLCD